MRLSGTTSKAAFFIKSVPGPAPLDVSTLLLDQERAGRQKCDEISQLYFKCLCVLMIVQASTTLVLTLFPQLVPF